jgi:hypothetical protein
MPYSLGEKGTHGCSGYPVIKTATGEVMGCHPTAGDAGKQLAALHINEPMKKDASITAVNPVGTPNPTYPGVGIKYPTKLTAARRAKKMTKRKKKTKNQLDNSNGSAGSFGSGGPGGSLGVAL